MKSLTMKSPVSRASDSAGTQPATVESKSGVPAKSDVLSVIEQALRSLDSPMVNSVTVERPGEIVITITAGTRMFDFCLTADAIVPLGELVPITG